MPPDGEVHSVLQTYQVVDDGVHGDFTHGWKRGKSGGGFYTQQWRFHGQNWYMYDIRTHILQMQQTLVNRDKRLIMCQRRGHQNAEEWLFPTLFLVEILSSCSFTANELMSKVTCNILTATDWTRMTCGPYSHFPL